MCFFSRSYWPWKNTSAWPDMFFLYKQVHLVLGRGIVELQCKPEHPWQGFMWAGYCRQWRFQVEVLLLLRKICCFCFGAKQLLPQGKSPEVCNDSALSGQRAVLLQQRRLRGKEKLRKFYQHNSWGQPVREQGSGPPFLDPVCCFWVLIPIPSLHLNLAEHEEWAPLCESRSPQGSPRIWGAWLIISA